MTDRQKLAAAAADLIAVKLTELVGAIDRHNEQSPAEAIVDPTPALLIRAQARKLQAAASGKLSDDEFHDLLKRTIAERENKQE